jgi:multidrug resistance efflux pump
MFGRRRYTDRMRIFVLLIAISLTLLVNVSGTLARPGGASLPLISLERHLAALRVQLEATAAEDAELQRPEVAFNAGIADGGTTSQWEAIATILRSATRRAAELRADQALSSADLDVLRIDLRTLEHRLARLRAASDETEAVEARVEAELTLASLERAVAGMRSARPN